VKFVSYSSGYEVSVFVVGPRGAKEAVTSMRKRDVEAKRVTILVNTEHVDHSQPVLERFDFIVAQPKDEWRLIRFLSSILRRSRIPFDRIMVEAEPIWASEDRLWSRQRIRSCIRNSSNVAQMLAAG